jgi:hypothetical protein
MSTDPEEMFRQFIKKAVRPSQEEISRAQQLVPQAAAVDKPRVQDSSQSPVAVLLREMNLVSRIAMSVTTEKQQAVLEEALQ